MSFDLAVWFPDTELDLPTTSLSPEELARAEKAFAGLGVTAAKAIGHDMYSFQSDFGTDVDRAATTALETMDDVYRLAQPALVIVEN